MGYKCPNCGDDSSIDVTITTWARLIQGDEEDEDRGYETDLDDAETHDHEWDGDSLARCAACCYMTKMSAFEVTA